ncbi:retrovirus-related pol polyprotein from transposon TNT 1-94 [Tanacetum coccineum]
MICGLFQNQALTSGTLPSNTIPNPKGEMKTITTRSGVAYEGPSIPTNPSPKKVVERETEETTDKEQTNFQGSTAQIPPPVIPISIPEPDVPKTLPKTTPISESDIPKNLRFDISFADALLLMPRFAPTIKSLLMNKEKLLELAKIPLNENCSAMLLKKLPEKLGDPDKFLIPCNFPGMDVCHALADLGASINLMPLSIWKKLSLPELTPTRMTLELADRSITYPKGLAEDVFVKVGKFHFPTDFVVVDFEADPRSPGLELKDLPSHLEICFHEENDKLPVIIAKGLKNDEKYALLKVLKSHKRAIAWKITDIKGIDPRFCTHKILMEDDYKPTVQSQRRVNPKIHEVIKKEVLKLLDAGMIYPISDSPWVSPVHCVPKKGGITVVANEENELIPTRLVTGWRVCIDYRKLNEATRKDHFPLPFMDQMLERLAGNENFAYRRMPLACVMLLDEIIPFVKALKDLFNTFDQFLIDELSEVKNVFHQMEQAVEQHRLESKTFEVKMNQVLNKNERLLEQVINKDIVNIIMNSSVDNASVNVHECEQCLKLETELLNKKDFVEKRIYDKLFKSFTTLEKHCISLEVDSQLNQEIFQRDNSVSNQSAPSFDQYFELNELKAQSQEKDTVIKKLKERIKSLSGKVNEDKIKKDLEEIETINIELDHRTLKIDVEPITLKLLNNKTAHSAYIKHTQEEVAVLRDLVEHVKANYPLDHPLDSALAETPKNKDKRVRFIEPVTSLGNTKTTSSSSLVSNKPALSSTGVKQSTSASGSQPSGNTKKDKIQRPSSSTLKNKVEAHPRTVKSSLKNKNSVVKPKGTANVQHSKLNANSKSLCVKCNGCMLSDNHDLCVLDFINNVNARNKSKSVKKNSKRKVWKPTGKVFTNIGYIWRPTGRTFTIVGTVCPLTRITTTAEVPPRKPTALKTDTPKPVTTLVYSRKPRKSKVDVPVSKPKILKSVSANNKEPSQSRGSIVSNVPSSTLDECRSSKLFSVAFRQHTYFIRNLEGVDLLTGSRGKNWYSLSLGDMMASFPICLLSKASKTKSWLWHRRLSHLNFGTINHLARHGLVRGLPKLKFEKDHMCSACAMGKSKKKPHKPKSEDTNQEKLYLLHMDLYGPMRVASVNGKKYILVNVDDYSRFTENLGKLQPKADIGIFIGYAPTKKAFRIYNRRTRRIIKTFHVDFDELTSMASEHSSSGPALHEMTPATISSGLVPNPPSSTPVDCPAPEVISPSNEVVAPEPTASTGSPSSTTVDQDAPSPSISQTTPETQSPVIPDDVEEDNHDLDVAHMDNDPYFGIPIQEFPSDQSSSSDTIHIIIEAMQEELNEFERLEV